MEKKKPIILSVIALLALVALVVGATFAYFQAQVGEGKSADVVVKSYTVDTFTFAAGSQISLNLDQENFASGKGNITGSTYASATLTANNKTNTATEHYYLYLNIENNTFTYSINESTPEIIMTVTDSSGGEITDISTLNHVIVNGANGTQVSGYDITNKNGLITLFNNREITTTSSKEERWNIKVTFVNYDASQNANAGKSMSAKVMIQKEEYKVLLTDYVKSLYISNNGENGIYYHDARLTNGAGDSSYRYSGANPNNYVCFGSNESTCPTDNLYRIIGVFGDKVKLIKSDYATSALLGTDGDYSKTYTATGLGSSNYKGNNFANIAAYTWNYKNNTTINSGNGSNTWSTSLLNKTNLNQNFITNIGVDWANKIDTTNWKVGGNAWSNIGTQPSKTAYQNEIVKPVPGSTSNGETAYSAKIGLVYISDYMYAAQQDKWTLIGFAGYDTGGEAKDYRAATSVNWMYMGLVEWTISRISDVTSYVARVNDVGSLNFDTANGWRAVRPVFYLKSSVAYVGGSGTKDSPITLVV